MARTQLDVILKIEAIMFGSGEELAKSDVLAAGAVRRSAAARAHHFAIKEHRSIVILDLKVVARSDDLQSVAAAYIAHAAAQIAAAPSTCNERERRSLNRLKSPARLTSNFIVHPQRHAKICAVFHSNMPPVEIWLVALVREAERPSVQMRYLQKAWRRHDAQRARTPLTYIN